MALVLGESAVEKLSRARVVVFGLGGVGGACAEALARAGVGEIALVDGDTVAPSNLNRQIISLTSNIGREKALVCAERLRDIHPAASITALPLFYDEQTAAQIDLARYDYVADAIDSVSSKLLLIVSAKRAGTPIVCCMGTGNKLNPMGFLVADIEETSVCPLARVMRRELKKRGISGVRVVYSKETPTRAAEGGVPGSVSFVPPAAGLLMAREIVMNLLK